MRRLTERKLTQEEEQEFCNLWTTEKDDYVLLRLPMDQGHPEEFLIFHLANSTSLVIDDTDPGDDIAEAVKQRMFGEGVRVMDFHDVFPPEEDASAT